MLSFSLSFSFALYFQSQLYYFQNTRSFLRFRTHSMVSQTELTVSTTFVVSSIHLTWIGTIFSLIFHKILNFQENLLSIFILVLSQLGLKFHLHFLQKIFIFWIFFVWKSNCLSDKQYIYKKRKYEQFCDDFLP